MRTSQLQRAADALQRAAFAEAERICVELLRAEPGDPDALLILGAALAHSGRTLEAEPVLERAQAASPGNLFALNCLGGVYAANGRLQDARAMLEAALLLDPRFPWVLQNLGAVLSELGDYAAAAARFERALEAKPDYADALSGLADIAEKENRAEAAQRYADRALAIAPNLPSALLVAARLKLNRGDVQAAADMLEPLAADPLAHASKRESAFASLGQAYEKLGRFDDAFEAFAAAGSMQGARRATLEEAPSAVSSATIARLTQFVRGEDVSRWSKLDAPEEPDPVFMIGFPRSGTTLLDQVLSSHPDIETLEETQCFLESIGPLVLADGGFARWRTLSQAEINTHRRAYWRRAKAALGRAPERARFIDKLPLNAILLPLIHRLFPSAKIIFSLRDPRDVVLSCFKQRFALNEAMAHFLSLEAAALYYDAVMRLADAARAKLPLDLHIVRYEDLVSDFDLAVAPVLAFLGLPWSDDVRNYAETAKARTIRTPSAWQVRQPITRAAVGKWRLYEKRFEPYAPLLDPWVRAFGYDAA